MTDSYAMMGEPSDAYIAYHNVQGKYPMYGYCAVPTFLAGLGQQGVAQMRTALTLDDLFHPDDN